MEDVTDRRVAEVARKLDLCEVPGEGEELVTLQLLDSTDEVHPLIAHRLIEKV
jgi:hypothetical protein